MRTLSVVGARPQFVKLAPVSRAMRKASEHGGVAIEDIIVHTGQHYDAGMSDIFFDELGIPKPDLALGIGSGPHGEQTARMLVDLEKALARFRPDVVIIYGDTNSTLAGALAAAKMHIPVAHIEAGLRSYDRRMPEEVNRIVSDHISSLLLAPTETAMRNLQHEDLAGRAVLVGDVMLDAVAFNSGIANEKSDILRKLQLETGAFVVATIHRAANTDTGVLCGLLDALNDIAERQGPVVFPAHPRTISRMREICPGWRAADRLLLIDPVGYLDMLKLLDGAALVLTDSGGLQKEAFFMGVPCVTLRDETEWPETVSAGANVLAGASRASIVDAAAAWEQQAGSRDLAAEAGRLFGDGRAAERIVESLGQLQ